jgi:hypothetical protein
MYLEEWSGKLEQEEGEPDPIGPSVDHLIDAVSTQHEPRDADICE